MNNYNTMLGQILPLINRSDFDRIVRETESDKFCKGFTTWTHFTVMAFAQITDQHGLRSIQDSLLQNRTSLYHLGLKANVNRSTLSYANNSRNPLVFEKIFYQLLSTLSRSERRKFGRKFYAVDATTISLNMNDFSWAEYKTTKSGVKIHMQYDVDDSTPEYLFITNAAEHENATLKSMKLKKGDIVAFDKGYNNYEQFQTLTDNGVYFVTRLKDNAKYAVIERIPRRGKGVSSDQIIRFNGKQTGKKCSCELRRIRIHDKKSGSTVVLLTNMKRWSAENIGKMYRARWNIETFFKTMKQNLRIKKFYGQTKNAVKTQIWIALIVYLLFLKLKEACRNTTKSFTHFMSELKVVIFQRRSMQDWMNGTTVPPPEQQLTDFMQLQLAFGR